MGSLAEDVRWSDATEQAALVRSRDVSPLELLEAAIERIEAVDPSLNAVVIRWFDHARAIARGPLPDGPFTGVPTLLKDLWASFAGQPLTNGNRALRDAGVVASEDTTLVARMRTAGFVIAGRTSSPELGSVPTTEPEIWGPTRNPWDTSRSPGGSSGGAAAAVAAGLVPVAHASDGGGSIRIPASCCGLVGLKPSQGRISLGPARDESNLGVELCVSRTVRDTAGFLDAVEGAGIGDSVSAPPPVRPYTEELEVDPGRLRVGVLDRHPAGHPVHPECAAAARAAADLLAACGHDVSDDHPAALGDPTFGRRFAALWSTNMAVNLVRIAEQVGRPLADDEVEAVNRAQAEHARAVSGVDHALALAEGARFRRAVHRWWAPAPEGAGFDLLLTPTLGEPPLPVGTFANDAERPMAPMARAAAFVPFTPAFNATGQPAISLPLHRSAEGLPIGVQLVAAYGREDLLLRVAAQLERARPWAHLRPPV